MDAFPRSSVSRASKPRWVALTVGAIGALYVGSTLLTPLYPLYERAFGFDELVVSEIYAAYVIGNLAVLFLFGRLSDQIGRRRVTLAALAITALSALCFLFATHATALFVGRAINGFGAGLGAAALTAWIAELEPDGDRARAAVLASSGNLAGLGLGALLAGVLAQFAPQPLHASFLVYLALLAVLVLALRKVPETANSTAPTLRSISIWPRIGIPDGVRVAFVAPAALAFSAFALGGFFAALLPGLLAHVFRQSQPVVIGAIVALFFGAASFSVIITRALSSRRAPWITLALLLVGLAALIGAETLASLPLLLFASLASGAAMALGYRGSLQIINDIAPADRRAELVSSYLLVCFCANALPVVGVSLLARASGPAIAHIAFACLLAVLASIGCAVASRSVGLAR